MSYRVAFLNDEEFERLPGNNMGSKVGVAYPKYGEAYVRKSGSNAVDVFSAMHELEHLEGSSRGEHYDSENQCYYKGFSDMLGPIGTIVGSMFGGPVGGSIGGMLGGAGSNLFGGGGKQQQPQQQSQGSMFAPAMQAAQQLSPATSMAQGASAGGASAGPVGGGAIKQLNSQFNTPDIMNQQYGAPSGRSPLMNAFGGL